MKERSCITPVGFCAPRDRGVRVRCRTIEQVGKWPGRVNMLTANNAVTGKRDETLSHKEQADHRRRDLRLLVLGIFQ